MYENRLAISNALSLLQHAMPMSLHYDCVGHGAPLVILHIFLWHCNQLTHYHAHASRHLYNASPQTLAIDAKGVVFA